MSKFKHHGSSGHNSPSRTSGGPSSKLRKRSHSKESRASRSTSLPPGSHEQIDEPLPIDIALDERKEEKNMTLFMVEVKLLSDEEAPLQLEVTNTCLGRALFNQVIERLNGIVAKDYFGLRYLDRTKQRQWLEMSKTVYKQLKYVSPRSLNFRVKHYPSNPLEEFTQEKTRYLLYLQLRRDLHSGRLIGRNVEMHRLAACILQAEIGDHDLLADYLGEEGTLADLKMFANVTPKTEAKICEFHKSLRGLSMGEAENKFLELASKFETYGIEPLYVQDRKGNHFYMGLNHEGVVTFRGSRKAHVFSWQKINKISYEGKLFIIQVEWEQRRHTLGFKCPTAEAAEALWKWAVDRQCFFTLSRSVDAKESKASGGIFKRRQFYTFTGRCQKELMLLNSSLPSIPQPTVTRSRSLLNLAKSVRQSRQSKSQNDLDRHLGASSDSLPDGHLSTANGLQRHKSVSDTRRAGQDDAAFSGTNQLGNQLGTRFAVAINNSQSTPSLIQPVAQTTPTDKQPNSTEQRSEQVEQQVVSTQGASSNERHPILKRAHARTRLVDSPRANTSRDTERKLPEKPAGESASNRVSTVSETGDKSSRLTNEETELSDVEQNAEATDQPVETGEVVVNTGSVNTLSSSPLQSADEDDDRDSEEDREDEEYREKENVVPEGQKNGIDKASELEESRLTSNRPVASQSRPVAPKRSTRPGNNSSGPSGNWLGEGGIKPFIEVVDTEGNPPNSIEQSEPGEKDTMQSRSNLNRSSGSWLHNGAVDASPPIPHSPPPYMSATAPAHVPHSTSTVTISITPSLRPIQTYSGLKASMPTSRSADFGEQIRKSDPSREVYQTQRSSPPPEFADAADVEEYIDSSEHSPPVGRTSSVTNVIRKPTPPTTYSVEQTYATNQNLYFPYARTVRPGGSTRSRSQDYKTLAAIPSRHSPTRRDIRFARMPQAAMTRGSNEPQVINLSAEHFTRAEPEQPLLITTEPRSSARAELIARARKDDRLPRPPEASHRSHDLSPQPRDWIYEQPQNESMNSQAPSVEGSGISELIISSRNGPMNNTSSATSYNTNRPSMHTTQPTPKPVCEEVCTHSVIQPCGLLDSTLPTCVLRQRMRDTSNNQETERSVTRASNDLLLNHGYAPQTSINSRTGAFIMNSEKANKGSLEVATAGSTAAQLAAGATARPYRTVSPVIGPSTSPPRTERKLSPVHTQAAAASIKRTDAWNSTTQNASSVTDAEGSTCSPDRKALGSPRTDVSANITDARFRRSDQNLNQPSPQELTRHRSMKELSAKVDEALRNGVERGERSINQLTRSVIMPPLATQSNRSAGGSQSSSSPPPPPPPLPLPPQPIMQQQQRKQLRQQQQQEQREQPVSATPELNQPSVPPNSTDSQSTGSQSEVNFFPLAQQLFYYSLVVFCVYKLTGWLHIRPTFGEPTEENSFLYRVILILFHWIFG